MSEVTEVVSEVVIEVPIWDRNDLMPTLAAAVVAAADTPDSVSGAA